MVPVTVRVRLVAPAVALGGEIEPIAGTVPTGVCPPPEPPPHPVNKKSAGTRTNMRTNRRDPWVRMLVAPVFGLNANDPELAARADCDFDDRYRTKFVSLTIYSMPAGPDVGPQFPL